MELNILDIKKFIKVNNIQRITNPIFLNKDGTPTDDGIFSTVIFGRSGSEERRTKWGYIDLGGVFLHPLIYKTCCQLDRSFGDIIGGIKRVSLKGGVLIEDEENGWTGIEGIQKNWDDITWKKADSTSSIRKERVELLKKVDKSKAFIHEWPVEPALYRDIDYSGQANIKEIPPLNTLYISLLNTSPDRETGFEFLNNNRKKRARDILLEIYLSQLQLMAKKNGLIQDKLLGRMVDYCVQCVITGPSVSCQKPTEQQVPFGYLGVPLHLLINLFQPFILKWMDDMFRQIIVNERISFGPDGKTELPPEVKIALNVDTYKKWIQTFMRSQQNRLDLITVYTKDHKEFKIPLYNNTLKRDTTLTDLFFIAANEAILDTDKHIVLTRYPVEDFRACHFLKPKIITTDPTCIQVISGRTYTDYPSIVPTKEGSTVTWLDSLRLNNSYCSSLGADYDGDRVRIVGVFTQEANQKAEEIMHSAKNLCDSNGEFQRGITNEGVLTLYCLTK